jgi:ornithine cyclodeaminase/alanine dehydrogenase
LIDFEGVAFLLYLSERDVERILKIGEVVEVVEEAFRALYHGRVILPLRTRVSSRRDGGDILSMPCIIEDFNLYTNKIVSVYPKNIEKELPTIHAVIVAVDSSNGVPLGLIEAGYLTALRTGAVSGVATKYLSRKDVEVLAIIGCGFQARTQAMGVSEVREIEKIYAYDIVAERAEKFASEMSRKLGLEVEVVNTAREAVEKADVICTATTSNTPVLRREWLKPGVHINAIGAYTPDMREIDTETIINAKVVVDLKEAALSEAGDIIIPIREGRYSEDRVYAELGEIVSGAKPGRTSDEEITVFKSVGLALQDNAAVYALIKKYLKELPVR